ncbi:major facilitator superfamily domain-containing protein [Fusarium flagelliforme]|uniref:Putative aflatoxin efflux pump aflt n=1 Tax=Fusarium flagelliforme TaxID=2675880 RepID=A0A395MFB2_9HYPO|nr:major facilitator superfamily domain-containing protein [Fusarium flagelliforme]KAH7198114.1 major facilitator superfamily domain-containing protein [Fusarium flagelliforme]RFN46564.1 putative aflatoxin efflux pump aflt [Fusarium flagelliforme]
MPSTEKTDSGLPERKSINSLSSAEPQIPYSSKQEETPESSQNVQQPSSGTPEPEIPAPQGQVVDQEALENYKPKTLKFWLIIVSVFSAMFLVALDRTIIATAIPEITNDFQSLGDIGWYGSAYMLTTAAFQLIFGRIYRFYDLRKTFLVCILTFEIGSAICGAAPNSVAFIVGRAIAGIGAAGIMTGSMMSIVPLVPLHKRPLFQSMFGMVFGISSVAGPLIGGAFTQHATWRWCFYMNLPVGAVASIFLFFFHTMSKKKQESVPALEHITRLDPLGTFFFVPSMVCLILALQWGGSTYAWSSWRLIVLFVIFGLTLIAFAIVQVKMPKTATIPVKVITQRTMLACAWISLLVGGGMIVVVYYLPLWFQATKGVSPVDSGVYTIPLVLSLVVASIISAAFTQRIGYYVPSMIICPCIMSIGQGLLTTINPDTGSSHWIAYQFLVGFGLGLGMQSGGLAIQATLPKEEVPTGLSITFFAQQLGGAIFVSVGQTILSGRLVERLSGVPGLASKNLVETGATELKKMVPSEYVPKVAEAYNYAITRIFYVGVALALGQLVCALCVEWRNIKPKKAESSPETGNAQQEQKTEES